MRLWVGILLVAGVPVLVALAVVLALAPGSQGAAVAGLVAGLAASLVLSTYLARGLLRPVAHLRSLAEDLGSSTVGKRILWHADEVAQLVPIFVGAVRAVRARLREAEGRRQETETLLARMADGVVVVDGDLRIRRVNPAAADVLALSPEKAVGSTIIEATMLHALDELFRDALAGGTTQVRRVETIQPQRRLLQVVVTPLGSAAGPGAVAVLQDLTEVYRMERVRRDFVTNVSHELRTPVTSIKVMAESLQRGALDQPDLRDEFLQAIMTSADRLAQLVDDVLALARIEAGPGRLQWHEVPLAGVVREVVASQQVLAREYQVDLALEEMDEVTLTGDAEGLRQAVANLVSNGIKYNRAGGSVRVRLRRVAQGVEVVVADTGIGIPPAHLPRVFERFYRVDRGRSREVGGTGLGLAIVKHVAEAHGGQVTVESELGRGSVFRLTLPEKTRTAGPPPEAPSPPS